MHRMNDIEYWTCYARGWYRLAATALFLVVNVDRNRLWVVGVEVLRLLLRKSVSRNDCH